MIGVFVPLNPANRHRKQSANVGWITHANGCDIWQGGHTKGGYAVLGGHLVHRIRYEREVGPIPEGLTLDHYVCDNGPGGCCNPHHCRPATDRENILRGNGCSPWNLAKTNCPAGHPLTGSNLVAGSLHRGTRKCRTCDLERKRAHRDSNREAENLRQRQRMDLIPGARAKAAAYARAWRVANREVVSAKRREHRRANADAERARQRECYAANREKLRTKRRAYVAAHRDEVNARQRAARLADPERFRAYRAKQSKK